MQLDRIAEAIDQLIECAALTDDGNFETLAHVPSTIAANHRVHGFARRRVSVCCVACSRLGNRTSLRFRTGNPMTATDFVQPARYSLKIIQAVGVVSRCVDTATTHDVREHGPCIEMRERQNDFVRPKPPAAAPATDPAYRVKNLVMDRHVLNLHL
jgi:hypothetical protein